MERHGGGAGVEAGGYLEGQPVIRVFGGAAASTFRARLGEYIGFLNDWQRPFVKQKTVMDLLPPMYAAMGAMPAGRLDKDTEGLLVITSDGQLAHRIISPRHEVGKVYYARLDGELTDEDVAALEAGIHIRDADGEFDARPAKLRRDGGDAAYIRVTEGKYHQVKRMFAARGKHVVYLKRMAIGSLALDPELKPGEWRELTDDEVALLEIEQFDGDFGTLDGIANETK